MDNNKESLINGLDFIKKKYCNSRLFGYEWLKHVNRFVTEDTFMQAYNMLLEITIPGVPMGKKKVYFRYKIIDSIWQMIKNKYLPKWFKRKYPVKYEKVSYYRTVNFDNLILGCKGIELMSRINDFTNNQNRMMFYIEPDTILNDGDPIPYEKITIQNPHPNGKEGE